MPCSVPPYRMQKLLTWVGTAAHRGSVRIQNRTLHIRCARGQEGACRGKGNKFAQWLSRARQTARGVLELFGGFGALPPEERRSSPNSSGATASALVSPDPRVCD